MWGIKKWPGRILQGTLAAGQIVNAAAVFFPPVIPVAVGIGVTQVIVSAWQHKSTEEGKPIPSPPKGVPSCRDDSSLDEQ